MRAILIIVVLVVSGCCQSQSDDALSDDAAAQESRTTISKAATFKELADRGATLKVVGVHYLATGDGLVTATIFTDIDTGERVRSTMRIGETFPQNQLQGNQEIFWAVGDRAKLYRRDDGAIVWQLATD